MVVRDHVLHDIGTGAGHDAFVKVGGVHIDDAAVGVAEVVHQSGDRLGGLDGQDLTVGLDALDLGIGGSAVVRFEQMVEALLDSGGVHVAAGGELHAVTQRDRPGAVAIVVPLGGEPGLELHGVGVVHECLTDAVADAGPAVVGGVGVYGLLPVFGVERGVADDEGLRTGRGAGRGLVAARTAGEQAEQQHGCQEQG